MRINSKRKDFVIEKKAKFYTEFQVKDGVGGNYSLIGKKIQVIIKESLDTSTVLHNLTETNGGIVVLDDPAGKYAMFIPADETNVDADVAFYDMYELDEVNPTEYKEVLLWGRIRYQKGA